MNLKAITVVVAATTLTLAGCAQDVTGTAVTVAGDAPTATAVPGGDDSQCTPVAAPLQDAVAESDREPLLRIPVPDGWERNTMMDSEIIRFAIVSTDLVADDFATNAVVTLENAPGAQSPEDVFEQNRDNLVTMMGAFDLDIESNTTCGLPSETTSYMAPPMGPAPERPIVMHAVVADTQGATFLATLTIQTTDPDNPKYIADSQEIIDGFQMVLPTS